MKIKILEVLRSKLGRWLSTEAPQSRGAIFDLKISENDKKWLRANYSDLKVGRDRDGYVRIKGVLIFDMILADDGQSYVIKPAPKHLLSGQRIQDKYQIEIIFKNSEHSNLPQVYEKDGRIKSVASAKNRRPEDLHINPGGAACLCIQQEEVENLPNGFNLKDFFNNLLIPFFYAQSYFKKNNTWPWGQYSHGVWGLVEWYSRQKNFTKQTAEDFLKRLKKYSREWQLLVKWLAPKHTVKGHYQCVCGSNEKFRNCHKGVLHGIWKLKEDVGKFGIKM